MSPELFCIPPHYRDSVESVLIPHGLVRDRVMRLASDIRSDYGDAVPHLLCVLKVRSALRHQFRARVHRIVSCGC
jgi:hypoxanthine phosphoribosyltransferase